MGRNQKLYTKEYKLQAVKLAEDLGSVTQAAKNLGISEANIYFWRSQFKKQGEKAFPGKGNIDDEKYLLEKENRQLRMELEFLKKAASYFASQQK